MPNKNRFVTFLLVFAGLNIALLLLGEAYFRLHVFGLKGLDIVKYSPAAGLKKISYINDGGIVALLPDQEGYLYGKPYRTNADGLWQPGDCAKGKMPGARRIACFGESFTMGTGVDQKDNYVSVLERRLNGSPGDIPRAGTGRVEVINCAVAGDSFNDSLIKRLAKACNDYHPDVVLIGLTSNFFPLTDEPFDKKSLIESSGKPGLLRRLCDSLYAGSFLLNSLTVLKDNATGYLARYKSSYASGGGPGPSRFSDKRISAYFDRIRESVKDKNVRVVIVLVRKMFSIHAPNFHKDFQDAVRSACDRYGYYFVNTYPSELYKGLDTGDLIIYPENEHPNKTAHAIFANVIYDAITGELLNSPDKDKTAGSK